MSQQQQQAPIKYGDIFTVQGELAEQTVAPRDAAMMQTAENAMLGHTQKGGAAAAMQSAAMHNERAGLVDHNDLSDNAGDRGVSISATDLPGKRLIIESVGGQVVDEYSQRLPLAPPSTMAQEVSGDGGGGAITIGVALEATALTAGQKHVDKSDAAAIQAAEVRATGRTNVVPGGIAAAAQSAATHNARATTHEDKTKLADVLSDAALKLGSDKDKAATRRDVEGVTGAEMRNSPYLTTHPTGVAASVAAAAIKVFMVK